MTWRILQGDCREVLRTLPEESVQCCVTSPPYWGLRDYGHAEQIGLERTPEEYVARMVEVFREVRRVLRPDGTLWLNLGDSYNSSPSNQQGGVAKLDGYDRPKYGGAFKAQGRRKREIPGLKPKDLVGIPWRVAFALQADGWWLRSDVVWAKPNPMPESVTDRPTRSHEYVFLLTKSERYFYDADAVREPWAESSLAAHAGRETKPFNVGSYSNGAGRNDANGSRLVNGAGRFERHSGRNLRSVWTISTKPFPGAHFAVMPWDLAERCVLAGSAPGSTVLDPFAGAGTTGMVARRHGRSFVGVELNPEYVALAERRIVDDAPLLNSGGSR